MSSKGDSGAGRKPMCFIIMPITVQPNHLDRYNKRGDHFEQIRDQLIEPAVRRAGYEPRSPIRAGSENIHAAIINDLRGAEMVLADLSTLNANVFLELGIRTALDRPMCLIWDGHDSLPFDTGSINSHRYLPAPTYELNKEIDRLATHLTETVSRSADKRNALWKYFGAAADHDLAAASLKPEDAAIERKIDRLTAIVERLAESQRDELIATDVAISPNLPLMRAIVSSVVKTDMPDAEIKGFRMEDGVVIVEVQGRMRDGDVAELTKNLRAALKKEIRDGLSLVIEHGEEGKRVRRSL